MPSGGLRDELGPPTDIDCEFEIHFWRQLWYSSFLPALQDCREPDFSAACIPISNFA